MRLPYRLVLHPSRRLTLLLVLLHLAAVASLLPLALPPALKVSLAVASVFSLVVSVRRHALLRSAASVQELLLKADGDIECLRNDGRWLQARVSAQSVVLAGLIVLRLLPAGDGGRCPVLTILPDALAGEDARILRSWLRWQVRRA